MGGGWDMKMVLPIGRSKNLIATIAIGNTYYTTWEKCALPSWIKYCERNELGLVVFGQDLIHSDEKEWKKATWQKMLIGETLIEAGIDVKNVCYLDSDILINHFAPNIFAAYDSSTIGLVSQINRLHQPLHLTLRRLAFLRHTHYAKTYPLDSALFMSPSQIFDFHKVPRQPDYACMGVIVFNVENHSKMMRKWFKKYDRTVESLTGGGDEPHMNYEIQNWGKITWLPYEFQALWTYEASWKYPFLFSLDRENESIIRDCIEASLYQNYFLHFAGSWHESQMWKIGRFFEDPKKKSELKSYYEYLKAPVTGNPVGLIKP
jgi:hypothetical protein